MKCHYLCAQGCCKTDSGNFCKWTLITSGQTSGYKDELKKILSWADTTGLSRLLLTPPHAQSPSSASCFTELDNIFVCCCIDNVDNTQHPKCLTKSCFLVWFLIHLYISGVVIHDPQSCQGERWYHSSATIKTSLFHWPKNDFNSVILQFPL